MSIFGFGFCIAQNKSEQFVGLNIVFVHYPFVLPFAMVKRLGHLAHDQDVSGSIPERVIKIFQYV